MNCSSSPSGAKAFRNPEIAWAMLASLTSVSGQAASWSSCLVTGWPACATRYSRMSICRGRRNRTSPSHVSRRRAESSSNRPNREMRPPSGVRTAELSLDLVEMAPVPTNFPCKPAERHRTRPNCAWISAGCHHLRSDCWQTWWRCHVIPPGCLPAWPQRHPTPSQCAQSWRGCLPYGPVARDFGAP